jgi:hypothetical protein
MHLAGVRQGREHFGEHGALTGRRPIDEREALRATQGQHVGLTEREQVNAVAEIACCAAAGLHLCRREQLPRAPPRAERRSRETAHSGAE